MSLETYHMVCLWAVQFDTVSALNEIQALKQKYPWLKCEKSLEFIKRMHNDLPRILHIVQLQEKSNTILRHENDQLEGYIKANGWADEIILDEIEKKFKIGI
jgi:hypothetical protein